MRQDKLTTKFQQALGEAQSLALAHDNQYIEPVHLLLAVMNDQEGSASSLIERSGGNAKRVRDEAQAAGHNSTSFNKLGRTLNRPDTKSILPDTDNFCKYFFYPKTFFDMSALIFASLA